KHNPVMGAGPMLVENKISQTISDPVAMIKLTRLDDMRMSAHHQVRARINHLVSELNLLTSGLGRIFHAPVQADNQNVGERTRKTNVTQYAVAVQPRDAGLVGLRLRLFRLNANISEEREAHAIQVYEHWVMRFKSVRARAHRTQSGSAQ